MQYITSKDTKTALYMQLYKKLKADITQEVYKRGEKLPSKRMLAERAGVSVITTEHALALLADEGYIEAKQKSGYFVIFSKDGGFAKESEALPEAKDIYIQQSDEIFPPSVLARTMRKLISTDIIELSRRTENTGHLFLRKAIAQYLSKNKGINTDEDHIIIGSGSEFLYGKLVELFGRDKLFAIEAPSYNKIEQVYTTSGATTERLPLGRDGIVSSALKRSDADILHISPYRSFPSGITASASKRHEYIAWAKNKNRYIIEDDFESEFSVLAKPEETVFSMSDDNNVIYMNSFTKTISPALRIGYMILPDHLMDIYKSKLGFYSCTVPVFEQLLTAQLIVSGDFERHINRVRRKKRKQRSK